LRHDLCGIAAVGNAHFFFGRVLSSRPCRSAEHACGGSVRGHGRSVGDLDLSRLADRQDRFQLSVPKRPQPSNADSESGPGPDKVPFTARLLLRGSLTARRAAVIIAASTVVITVGGGILERVFDHAFAPMNAG
jgi:hypothetical protein